MVLLCGGNYLLYQNDHNKMATDITSHVIQQVNFLNSRSFWNSLKKYLNEVFQTEIINRMILSSNFIIIIIAMVNW